MVNKISNNFVHMLENSFEKDSCLEICSFLLTPNYENWLKIRSLNIKASSCTIWQAVVTLSGKLYQGEYPSPKQLKESLKKVTGEISYV